MATRGSKPTKMTLFDDASRVEQRRRGKLERPMRWAGDLRRKYGITPELYDAIAEMQGEACAICGRARPYGEKLHVDHNHDKGYVRGLLCKTCNMAVGLFHDDPAVIRSALEYIEFALAFNEGAA